MTKTDFAELKRVLCINPAISFDIPDDMQVLSIKTMKDLTVSVVDHQHTKSSAIISELIEIIQSQSEALEEYHDLHYAPKLDEVLSETTTRLQKLRDGK